MNGICHRSGYYKCRNRAELVMINCKLNFGKSRNNAGSGVGLWVAMFQFVSSWEVEGS
jgi:hypothetical protein